MKLKPYLEEVNLALSLKNGTVLAELLCLKPDVGAQHKELIVDCQHMGLSQEVVSSLEHFRSLLPARVVINAPMTDAYGDEDEDEDEEEDERSRQEMNGLWNDIIALHLRVLLNCSSGNKVSACNEQLALIQTFHRIFQASSRWLLPLAHALHGDLWCLCRRTGSRRGSQTPPSSIDRKDDHARINDHLREESARMINRGLTICLTDRAPLGRSRKWGVYRMASLLLRVYFALGQLNLCNNVLRALSTAELPATSRYPIGQLVTWRYWLGRYYFVNGEWERALGELAPAFVQCLSGSERNKVLVLHMLIPLRLHLQGVLPSLALLQRYRLASAGTTTTPPSHLGANSLRTSSFYVNALNALRGGDLRTYTSLLHDYELVLLRLGTFLLWEQLLSLAYRNLFRRTHRLMGGETRLPLGSLLLGLRLGGGSSINLDEVACHVANLIGRGLIRGYIHQERATLVLSQKDPFPKLSAVE